jgi:hypothetical protein
MNYQKLTSNLDRSISLISWMREAAESGDDCLDVITSGLIVIEHLLVQQIAEQKKEAHAS